MKEQPTTRVVIGMDPHKRSVTIEVMRPDESVAAGGRFGTDRAGYAPCSGWRRRGRSGCGRSRAATGSGVMSRCGCSRTGSKVIDVPPRLSARVRMFATGLVRKTDATDAHSIAMVGVRMAGLRPVVNDEQVPGQQPLRVLDGHRPDRRLVRGPRVPPAVAGWGPSDQPGAAHHGDRAAAQPDRRASLLQPHQGPGEDLERGNTAAQTQAVRHRVPDDARRRGTTDDDAPGRATG